MMQERMTSEGGHPNPSLVIFRSLLVCKSQESLEKANPETRSAQILILHETMHAILVATSSAEKLVTMFKNIMSGIALKTTFFSFNFSCLKGLINCVNS